MTDDINIYGLKGTWSHNAQGTLQSLDCEANFGSQCSQLSLRFHSRNDGRLGFDKFVMFSHSSNRKTKQKNMSSLVLWSNTEPINHLAKNKLFPLIILLTDSFFTHIVSLANRFWSGVAVWAPQPKISIFECFCLGFWVNFSFELICLLSDCPLLLFFC